MNINMTRTDETGLAKSVMYSNDDLVARVWSRNYGSGVHGQNDGGQHPRERNIGSDGGSEQDRTHQHHHLSQHILHHHEQVASDRLIGHTYRSLDAEHDYSALRRNRSMSLVASYFPNAEEPLQPRGSNMQSQGGTWPDTHRHHFTRSASYEGRPSSVADESECIEDSQMNFSPIKVEYEYPEQRSSFQNRMSHFQQKENDWSSNNIAENAYHFEENQPQSAGGGLLSTYCNRSKQQDWPCADEAHSTTSRNWPSACQSDDTGKSPGSESYYSAVTPSDPVFSENMAYGIQKHPRSTNTPRVNIFKSSESHLEIALRPRISYDQRLAPLGRGPYHTPNRADEVGVLVPYSSAPPLGASCISDGMQDPVKWSSSLAATTRQWSNTQVSLIQRGSTDVGSSTTVERVVNEKPACRPKKETRGRKKRAKDMPKRPLSAYNLFFKQERLRIVNSQQPVGSKESPADAIGATAVDVSAPSVPTAAGEVQNNGPAYSTHPRSASDNAPTIRKDRAIPHRKIGFESLAKVIGKRWKSLPEQENALYQTEAAVEMQTYRTQMKKYIESKSKTRNGVSII
jgi:hypothetical protein